MAVKRQQTLEIQSLPLQHLTEDRTDEFELNKIAKKLYEFAHFYKVNKSSINHVFLEKHASDYRLGYFLECMGEMELILPIFN